MPDEDDSNNDNVGTTGARSTPSVETNNISAIGTVAQCRLPPFWRLELDLWFTKVEAILHCNRITSDISKYNLVITALEPEALTDVSDILRQPPESDKYLHLKTGLISGFTDSSDKQLHKQLSELELGNKKPSQLLRNMRTLANNRASEDVVRVRWFALLSISTQRFLKIVKNTQLTELAELADE